MFFLKALDQQKNRLAARIERERIIVAQLPALSVRILDFAREHGRVSTGDMVRFAGASRNTLKQQFRMLVERGYLMRHGGGRTTWYRLRQDIRMRGSLAGVLGIPPSARRCLAAAPATEIGRLPDRSRNVVHLILPSGSACGIEFR
jgi:DNA-binding IclR family transcriptional regulator